MNFLHIFGDREMIQFCVVFIEATMVILCQGLVENGTGGWEGTQKFFFVRAFLGDHSTECPLMTSGAH